MSEQYELHYEEMTDDEAEWLVDCNGNPEALSYLEKFIALAETATLEESLWYSTGADYLVGTGCCCLVGFKIEGNAVIGGDCGHEVVLSDRSADRVRALIAKGFPHPGAITLFENELRECIATCNEKDVYCIAGVRVARSGTTIYIGYGQPESGRDHWEHINLCDPDAEQQLTKAVRGGVGGELRVGWFTRP